MINGNGSDGPAPSVESLQAELAQARQVIEVLRQQRDQAAAMANNMQVELVLMQQKLAEAAPPAPLPAEREHAVD